MRSTKATDAASLNGPKKPSPGGLALPTDVYQELRNIAKRFMSRESRGHSLQPTALLHEAYLKMAGQEAFEACSPTHLRALFAQAMHRILIDHARRRATQKRGGLRLRVALDERLLSADAEHDLLDLQAVLEKLAVVDVQQARLVELRIFGGLTVAEVAQELGIAKRTAEREWTAARAWLRSELAAVTAHDS
jgi:RNA polymerase sigma-70 factor, ECF subfamily